MNHIYSFLQNLLNASTSYAERVAYLILYFFSVYPCFKYIKNNFGDLGASRYIVFCLILIATLTLIIPFLYRHRQKHTQRGLCVILPLACICACATSPSLLHMWTDGMISISYITGFLAVTYSLLRKWSFILWFLWLLFPLAETLASMRYQLTVDAHLISEIIGASPQDIAQFITLPNMALILLWLIGTLLLGISLTIIIRGYTEKRLFIPGIAIIMFAWGITTATNRSLWSFNSPLAPENKILAIIQATKLAKNANSRIIRIAEELPSPASPKPVIPEDKQSSSSICLLHIGESVRSDHLSLFGYSKHTTPNLEKIENIIAYRDCISVAPSTVPSTFAILTNAKTDIRQEDIDPSLEASCGGIMDIFHSLGFRCFAFMSNEDKN